MRSGREKNRNNLFLDEKREVIMIKLREKL